MLNLEKILKDNQRKLNDARVVDTELRDNESEIDLDKKKNSISNITIMVSSQAGNMGGCRQRESFISSDDWHRHCSSKRFTATLQCQCVESSTLPVAIYPELKSTSLFLPTCFDTTVALTSHPNPSSPTFLEIRFHHNYRQLSRSLQKLLFHQMQEYH